MVTDSNGSYYYNIKKKTGMERDFIFQQSIFSRTLQKESYWGRTLSNRNSGDFAEIGGGKDIKKIVATTLLC